MLHANTIIVCRLLFMANSNTCIPCGAAPDMVFIIHILSQHTRAIEQASCCFSRDVHLDLLFPNLCHWTPVRGVTHLICIAIMPQEQMCEVDMCLYCLWHYSHVLIALSARVVVPSGSVSATADMRPRRLYQFNSKSLGSVHSH